MRVWGVGVCVCVRRDSFSFLSPQHLSTSLFILLCVYTNKHTSHISQHLRVPSRLVTSSAPQATHQVTQGQARLCSGVEATLSHSPLHSFPTARLFLTCLLLRCCSSSSPLSLSGCEVSGCPLPAQRPVPSAGGEDSARALRGEATGLAPAGCLKPSALCRVSDEQIPSLDEQFPGQEVPRGWAVSVRTPPGKVPGRALLPWGAPYSPG